MLTARDPQNGARMLRPLQPMVTYSFLEAENIDFRQYNDASPNDALAPLLTPKLDRSGIVSPPVYAPIVSGATPQQHSKPASHSSSPSIVSGANILTANSTDNVPVLPGLLQPSILAQPPTDDSRSETCSSTTWSSDRFIVDNYKAVVLLVSATSSAVLTARFFCSRLTHFLAWGGDSARFFILGPNEDTLHRYGEAAEEQWSQSLEQLASCVTEYLGMQHVLGLAATPTAIILGDFEHEEALSGAEATLKAAWLSVPGLKPTSQPNLFSRYIRFSDAWRTEEDMERGLSTLRRSYIDVHLSLVCMRCTRSQTGVICSMVANYLTQMLPVLSHIFQHEPTSGDSRSTIVSLPPLFFTRHGQSEYNIEDRLGGNPNLTEEGLADAVAIAEFFEREVRHNADLFHACETQESDRPPFEVWCSQLRRTEQTAAPVAQVLTNGAIRKWSQLNEIHAGVCEDMTNSEVKGNYPALHDFRKQNKVAFRYPAGESYLDLMIRLKPILLELEATKKCVVVVAHQAVLRTLLSFFGGPSVEEAVKSECPHRTVWCCTFDKAGCPRLATISLRTSRNGTAAAATSATRWEGW